MSFPRATSCSGCRIHVPRPEEPAIFLKMGMDLESCEYSRKAVLPSVCREQMEQSTVLVPTGVGLAVAMGAMTGHPCLEG